MRRAPLALVMTTLFALLVSASASAQTQTVRLAWNKTWDVLPLIVAEKKGYWRDRRVDVKFTEITGSPQGVQAIHAGEVDAEIGRAHV